MKHGKRKISHKNYIDAINAYLAEEISWEQLSYEQQRKYERLIKADEFLRDYRSFRKAAPRLHRFFNDKYTFEGLNISYSIASAFKDCQDAEYILSTNYKHNKNYQIEVILEQIAQDREAAIKKNDPNAMARCTKNLITAVEKFLGDKETFDPELIQLPPQLFTFDPKLLGVPMPEAQELQRQLEKLRTINIDEDELPELEASNDTE